MESRLDLINNRKTPEELLAGIMSTDESKSRDTGTKIVRAAQRHGVSIPDYLRLSIRPDYEAGLDGFERTLAYLNLPIADNVDAGILLEAAGETFQTYPGTRMMFPPVIDEMVRWSSNVDPFDRVEDIVAQSRTINGTELVSTIIDDDETERQAANKQVPELGRIPVYTVRDSEQSVKIWKHGSALRTSYEFERRRGIDVMRPFAARIARELQRSKARAALYVIINGDGVNGAVTEIHQDEYNAATNVTSVAGAFNWEHLLYWLVERAKIGEPIDTLIMNWDLYFKWQMLFAKPVVHTDAVNTAMALGPTQAEGLAKAGVQMAQQALSLNLSVTPVVLSDAPANKIVGIRKAECIEELKEAGSDVNESERAILNQSITVTKTENTGYKLVWPKARTVLDLAAS